MRKSPGLQSIRLSQKKLRSNHRYLNNYKVSININIKQDDSIKIDKSYSYKDDKEIPLPPKDKNAKNFEPLLVINDTSKEFLKLGINLIFLLNGGAITAIIALGLQKYIFPIYFFGTGALASAVIPILFHYSLGIFEYSSQKTYKKIHYISRVINFISIWVPIVCFFVGGVSLVTKVMTL